MDPRNRSRRRARPPLWLLAVLLLNVLAVYALYRWQTSPEHSSFDKPEASQADQRPAWPAPNLTSELSSPEATVPGPVAEPPANREKPSPDKPAVFYLAARTRKSSVPINVQEGFDKTERGLPKGWSRWSSQAKSVFGVSDQAALSAPHSLAISGSSTLSARAWLADTLPADIQAGAAVFLNTLIPAQVLVRGSDLETVRPTYYALTISRGLEIQLLRVVHGSEKVLATVKSSGYLSGKWVRATIRAKGKQIDIQVFRPDTNQYLDSVGRWVAENSWAIEKEDTAIAEDGCAGLARRARYSGSLFFDDFIVTPPGKDGQGAKPATIVARAQVPALARPEIPRHYSHIRVAMLAYAGNPFRGFEDALLKESVDLVVPNAAFMRHIYSIAPRTPQLLYTNTSNLYLELLMSWLSFADAKGLSREAAFYHAARPRPFKGNSPSSRPATWFWGVYRGQGDDLANLTPDAHRGRSIPFTEDGRALYLGHPDQFREINLDLVSGAGRGWSAVLEYPTATDQNGNPTQWQALAAVNDTTAGLARSGRIVFDPPGQWKTASLQKTVRLYYVRFRATNAGNPPIAQSILGRDYLGANGGSSGVIPAFDRDADANHDGYLDDQEYARRAVGKDARFIHESRMLTESYGQMRFVSRPSGRGFRDWAVEYHLHLLQKYPLAGGLFMDNSDGRAPINAEDAIEPVATFAEDYGAMLNAISRASSPRWVLANTPQHPRADTVVRWNPNYLIEFAIRPLSHSYVYFEDLADAISRRSRLSSPAPIAVIDSHPQRGDLTDPRMQLSTLACYYLISDPELTFLMLYGGFEPGTTWRRHWLPAVAFDVGRPVGKWSQWTSGADPADGRLTYRLYRRDFQKALVLYKPLSYARGVSATPSLGDETATRHELGGSYRPLQADGTLGEPLSRISLRNGEGAILVKGE